MDNTKINNKTVWYNKYNSITICNDTVTINKTIKHNKKVISKTSVMSIKKYLKMMIDPSEQAYIYKKTMIKRKKKNKNINEDMIERCEDDNKEDDVNINDDKEEDNNEDNMRIKKKRKKRNK